MTFPSGYQMSVDGELIDAVVEPSTVVPELRKVTVSRPYSPRSSTPSVSHEPKLSSRTAPSNASSGPTAKSSTTGLLKLDERSGATACGPAPRLAKAIRKRR